MRLYHYTFEKCAKSIIDEGKIKASLIGTAVNGVDLVWLSSNRNLEMSIKKSKACKDLSFVTIDDLLRKTGGICRFSFEFNEELFRKWSSIRSSSPISRSITSVINYLGDVTGANTTEWYAHVGKELSIKDAQFEVCQMIDKNGNAIWKQVLMWRVNQT